MEFELLNTTNINLIRDCFNRCRKRNFSLDFFKKKYSTKWSGMPLLGIIAMDGDIPIALRCTTIYKFNSVSCNYKVAQCGDLVVDENYRNKGLATEMIMGIEKEAIRRKNSSQNYQNIQITLKTLYFVILEIYLLWEDGIQTEEILQKVDQ